MQQVVTLRYFATKAGRFSFMKYHILMGDVIESRKRNQIQLHIQLKALIIGSNRQFTDHLLSPYTITLGDEFQGVARSLRDVVETLFFLEEEILRRNYEFKLHYVAHFGEIGTSINPDIAYEMMGSGLTRARSLLMEKHRRRPRFLFDYDSYESTLLNDLFFLTERLIDHWKIRDFQLVLAMINSPSNTKVAISQRKDRTVIWRKRDTLRVEEYLRLKRAIFAIVDRFEYHVSF